jgi:hypothetical protein
MKVGDLVKLKHDPGPVGFVVKIDKDFFGSTKAFKSKPVPRGYAIRDHREPDFISPTKRGIRDRVMVEWVEHGCEYIESDQLEVVSESE